MAGHWSNGISNSRVVLAFLQWVLAAYAPNHFLGTCLDRAWVKSVETQLNISASTIDAEGRHVYPYLRSALQSARFKVLWLFSCRFSGFGLIFRLAVG